MFDPETISEAGNPKDFMPGNKWTVWEPTLLHYLSYLLSYEGVTLSYIIISIDAMDTTINLELLYINVSMETLKRKNITRYWILQLAYIENPMWELTCQ